MYEGKIASVKAETVNEVRTAAAELAISAATSVIADATKGAKGNKLIDESIALIKTKLN